MRLAISEHLPVTMAGKNLIWLSKFKKCMSFFKQKMNRLLNDIPSIPKIPSFAPLHIGITTRVMAKRQELERKRKNSKSDSVQSNRRRSSRFLEGAARPNSIIYENPENLEPELKDSTTRRKERDEYVAKLVKRLHPEDTDLQSSYDEDGDREALKRIKEELRRSSVVPLGNAEQQKRLRIAIQRMKEENNAAKVTDLDPWEMLKEKRRISHRTAILAPLSGKRRSTYESIKNAIQNSTVIKQLLDADNIEKQKIKNIQTGSSILPDELKQNFLENFKKFEKSTTTKVSKKETQKSSSKEKKITKRKLKGENIGILSDRLLIKKKSSNDSKKYGRKKSN